MDIDATTPIRHTRLSLLRLAAAGFGAAIPAMWALAAPGVAKAYELCQYVNCACTGCKGDCGGFNCKENCFDFLSGEYCQSICTYACGQQNCTFC